MEKKEYFYRRHNLRIVTGFLSPEDYARLKQIAFDNDKSLARYVTRLLERHIKEMLAQGDGKGLEDPQTRTK